MTEPTSSRNPNTDEMNTEGLVDATPQTAMLPPQVNPAPPSAPTEHLASLSATLRDLQNKFEDMQSKYDMQVSEVTALRLRLAESRTPHLR
ncbi:hypothetical protein Vretimale_19284 [Volvox reticuliferus]|uniref:Uncharacterized protein n=1 Tax=Volvox reticuliferus TaxID=1737510 RepID=A0A8J4H063_9CHLO|nr:hypothetical protein Vretimale_19284 [Volvox reticuliferus]